MMDSGKIHAFCIGINAKIVFIARSPEQNVNFDVDPFFVWFCPFGPTLQDLRLQV